MDRNTSKPPLAKSQASVMRGRLPRAEVDSRIDHLLVIALEEFSAAGFSGTSLDRLVERSGVSKTTMMRRFGSKLGLFEQLVQNCGASVKAQLWAVQLDPDDPTGTLTTFIQTYMDVAVLAPEGRMLLEVTVAERKAVPDLSALILENGREGLQPISSYIRILMERGVLAPGDPLSAAFDLQALITHGFRFMVDTLSFVEEPDRAAQISARFLKGWA